MRRTAAARIAIAVAICVLFAGCGSGGGSPTAVIIVDVSGSTRHLQQEFQVAATGAITRTAMSEGNLWAANGDTNVLANSGWVVDGMKFTAPNEGAVLQKEDLRTMAEQFANSKQVGRLFARTGRQGSDLLGMLKMASDVTSANPGSSRSLLFLTDGGINELGVNLAVSPPATPKARTDLIKRFEALGLVTKDGLSGGNGQPVKVWLCGIGRGVTGGEGLNALRLRAFWTDLIAHEGGVATVAQSCANLEGFASE